MFGADERVIEIVPVRRAPERRGQLPHPVPDEAELVRRHPVVRGAAHAHDRGMAQEATGHESRSAALHAEDEDRPVEWDLIHRGEMAPQRAPPAVAAPPALGLDSDRPEEGPPWSRIAIEKVRKASEPGRHGAILPGALASLS